ncbi:hypothetical protein SIN09_07245 [Streptomyces sp. F8]|nr:hypothetical protein [Streptomyces sp. F8]MDX6759242.1 hypothetical protein [Streptomyces sp. F8]
MMADELDRISDRHAHEAAGSARKDFQEFVRSVRPDSGAGG